MRRGRGVTATWNWRFVLVDAFDFVLVEVLCVVGGVTVDSFEEHCPLVNPPEANEKFVQREPVNSSGRNARTRI